MTTYVKFVVYTHGNIVNDVNGPEHNRDAMKLVKIRVGATHVDFCVPYAEVLASILL